MFPRILYAIFISQGLLAAQSPPAAGTPPPTEPTLAAPVADEGVPPATPAVEDETVIIGTIAEGTPPAPAPEPRLPNFKFKSTTQFHQQRLVFVLQQLDSNQIKSKKDKCF